MESADNTRQREIGMDHPISKPVRTVIVMPVFNGAQHITRSINLAHETSPQDCHLIAIDNGSTDNSFAVLHRLSLELPGRLHSILNEENQGFPAACNQGI